MKVIWNGNEASGQEAAVQLAENRGMQYADGFFETFVLHQGKSLLLPYHLKRIEHAAKVFGLELPDGLTGETLADWLARLSHGQPLTRAKLMVWRKAGGLYTPHQNKTEFLLTGSRQVSRPITLHTVSLSQNVRLQHTPWSACKSLNALPYVFAGKEKKERELGEIILTDIRGNLAEAGAANLFWEDRQGQWYTPSLSTGCIAGVMRAYLLDRLSVIETESPPHALKAAQRAFVCNVSGIFALADFEGKAFDTALPEIRQLIPQPLL